jgi:hypothetical protein
MDLPNTRLWRDDPRPMASSPLIVVPIAPSVPSCSEPSRCGLARAENAGKVGATADLDGSCARRPEQSAGRDEETALRSNKDLDEDALRCRNSLTENAPYKACSGFTRVTARQIAQPPKGDLCHEAPALPVARPSRSSATRSIDNSLGGFFLH